MKAVLDSNIFVSGLFWRGAPYETLQKGLGGAFVIVISLEILKEIERVLQEKFKFPSYDTGAYLEVIALNAQVVEPDLRLAVVKSDSADNRIVECAVAGKAEYIVTGDRHLLELERYKGIKILTPNKFLRLLL